MLLHICISFILTTLQYLLHKWIRINAFLLFDEHLGCFQFCVLINNAAVNILVQLFVWMYVFNSLQYVLSSRIAKKERS